MEPRIRVAAIVLDEDRVLLVQHEKDERSYWLLPGGGVQYGESLDQALIRELKEEVNLDIDVSDLVLANDSIAPDGSRHIVNLYFQAGVIGGQLAVGTDARVVGARFVPVSDLDSYDLRPDIRDALVSAIRSGFTGRPVYLGLRWKDQ